MTQSPTGNPDHQKSINVSNTNSNNNNIKTATKIPARIFIGGLSNNNDKETLFQTFSKIGEILDYKVIRDKQGISKGYGFVTFRNQRHAEYAIQNLDKTIFLDGCKSPLNISQAITNNSSNNSSSQSSISNSKSSIASFIAKYCL